MLPAGVPLPSMVIVTTLPTLVATTPLPVKFNVFAVVVKLVPSSCTIKLVPPPVPALAHDNTPLPSVISACPLLPPVICKLATSPNETLGPYKLILDGTRTALFAIKSKLVPDNIVGVFAPDPIKLTATTLLPTVKLPFVLSNVKLASAPITPSSLNCTCVLDPATLALPVLDSAQVKLPAPSVVRTKLALPPVIVTLPTLPKLAVLVATKLLAVKVLIPSS